MNIYFGIKYVDDFSNRHVIESILSVLEQQLGHQASCIVRDVEEWGRRSFSPAELMQKTFEIMDSSDLILIEFSEKGTGLGIEAGYGYSRKKPILVIAQEGSDISATLQGIADHILFYQDRKDLEMKLTAALE